MSDRRYSKSRYDLEMTSEQQTPPKKKLSKIVGLPLPQTSSSESKSGPQLDCVDEERDDHEDYVVGKPTKKTDINSTLLDKLLLKLHQDVVDHLKINNQRKEKAQNQKATSSAFGRKRKSVEHADVTKTKAKNIKAKKKYSPEYKPIIQLQNVVKKNQGTVAGYLLELINIKNIRIN